MRSECVICLRTLEDDELVEIEEEVIDPDCLRRIFFLAAKDESLFPPKLNDKILDINNYRSTSPRPSTPRTAPKRQSLAFPPTSGLLPHRDVLPLSWTCSQRSKACTVLL